MSEHTKGPWSFTANSWQYTSIYDAKGRPICQLDLDDWGVTEENQDDLEKEQAEFARLIAASPELYKALEDALCELTACANQLTDLGRKVTPDGSVNRAIISARAALSAARGK